MIPTERSLEDMTLTIRQETHVKAPMDITFTALLEQLGPGNEAGAGKPMPMVIEPWPGGRWYRDLGDGNGHFWANVQAIKRPALLEFAGPLFASSALFSNVQYRLTAVDGGTLISFRHNALGLIPAEQKAGLENGWAEMTDRARAQAESESA